MRIQLGTNLSNTDISPIRFFSECLFSELRFGFGYRQILLLGIRQQHYDQRVRREGELTRSRLNNVGKDLL